MPNRYTTNLSQNELPLSISSEVTIISSNKDLQSINRFTNNHTEGLSGNKLSNLLNVYDLWPRFVRGYNTEFSLANAPKKTAVYRQLTERIGNTSYEGTLKITPAILTWESADKGDTLAYPSDREENVESALISLASQGKLFKLKNNKQTNSSSNYAVHFTIIELINELKSVNKSLSNPEVKKALNILKGSELMFKYQTIDSEGNVHERESKMNYLSSIHFSSTRGRGDVKCIAVFNEFMTKQIESLEYRGYYFNRSMQFRRALSRWLSKRLYQIFRYANQGSNYHFSLIKMMVKYGAINQEDTPISSNKLPAIRRDMTNAIKDLIKANIIAEYTIERIKVDGISLDYKYTIKASSDFANEILALNRHRKKLNTKTTKRIEQNEL